MTDIGGGPDPDHGSSSARTAGGPGSPTTSRSRTSAAARTASPATSSDRGEQAKGVVVAYDRRFASEHFARGRRRGPARARHPGRHQPDRRADPDELVRGRPARRGGGDRDHGVAQPVDRQRVQGQVADRRGGGPRHPAVLEASDRRATAAGRSSAARSPTPRRPGSSSGSTRTRATSGSSAGRSTSTRSGPPTSRVLVEPLYGAGSGWIPRLLAGGRIRVTEIHNERNPFFGGVNPEPIRPNVDEALAMIAGGGFDLGLLLDGDADRAGAADERGTFIHQLQVTGLLMYYLAEHRGLREPVVVSASTTPRWRRGSASTTASTTHEIAGRLQVHRPEDDRDRGDARRRGVRRLRVRDAPPRARRDLRRPDAARPVPARAGAPGAGRCRRALAQFHELAGPSFYRRIDVHVERADVRRRQAAAPRRPRGAAPPTALAGEPVARTQVADDERRVQVLPRRRVVAARPRQRDRAARPRLHGGDVAPSCATRCSWPGERLVRGS